MGLTVFFIASICAEIKFWGEVFVEFWELDKTDADKYVEDLKREMIEQKRKEQKKREKYIQKLGGGQNLLEEEKQPSK